MWEDPNKTGGIKHLNYDEPLLTVEDVSFTMVELPLPL
jgi:hypothetical protein